MTTETNKVNKMAIAKAIYAEVTADASVASPRKAFMQRFIAEGPASKDCASAYYQMNKNAAANGGKLYVHHSASTKKRKEKAAAAAEPIARPE